jgi:hypothetical protein
MASLAPDPAKGKEDVDTAAPPDRSEPEGASNEEAQAAADFAEALKALRKLGLDLPEDTTAENFAERVIVAVRAILATEQQGAPSNPNQGTTRTPPQGSTEQTSSVAMGTQPMANDPMFAQTPGVDTNNPLYKHAQLQAREGYIRRVNSLIRSGRVKSEFANEKLQPMITGFQLSLTDEGASIPGPLDQILEVLEQVPGYSALTGQDATRGYDAALALNEETLPSSYTRDERNTPDDAQVEDILKVQAEAGGRPELAGAHK